MQALQVENVSKSNMIGHNSTGSGARETFRDTIVHNVRNLAHKTRHRLTGRQGDEVEEIWALNNITTTFNSATAVGLASRGGPGQTTGLKILSRFTEPTQGRMTINGHVVSLCLPEPRLYYSPNSSLIQKRV